MNAYKRTDLVERLRKMPAPTAQEAVDVIERLQAELLAAVKAHRATIDERDAVRRHRAEVCVELKSARMQTVHDEECILELKAELAELRAGRATNMPAYVRRALNIARTVEELQAYGKGSDLLPLAANFIVARADELDKKEEAEIDAARKGER
jgi:hypothetical protein